MSDNHDWQDDFLHDFRQPPPGHAVDALWQRLAYQEEQRQMVHKKTVRRLAWATIVFVVVSAVIFSLPQARSLAQDIIDLFVQTEDDQLDQAITLPPVVPADAPRPHIISAFAGSTATFERAMALVDFVITEPVVPEPYELVRIQVRDQSLVAEYHSPQVQTASYPEGILFIGIRNLVTWESETDDRGLQVGASAQIIPIDLGYSVQAEYVTGAWVHPETGDFGSWETTPTDTGILVHRVWDNAYPGQRLRWIFEGVLYTVYGYNLELDQNDLTAIARSMLLSH